MEHSLTDTHCHLNSPRFAGRVDAVVARAQAAGVRTLLVPAWDEASAQTACTLATTYAGVWAAVGLHPWFVTPYAELAWVAARLADPAVVAIGEIGLDGAATTPVSWQEPLLRAQLALARVHDRPVLLHCRQAWDRLLACLDDYPGVRGVVHAFAGSRELLRECTRRGLYVSCAGLVTRPGARRAREAALQAPADRLLLETDAPNLGLAGLPAAAVEPAHLPQLLTAVAALRGEAEDTLAAHLAQNARTLFPHLAHR
jgi:TatD DNase family protein